MKKLLLVVFLLLVADSAYAQVVNDACTESHTGVTGSTNEASFTFDHTPVGTARGLIISTYVLNSITDMTSTVTADGTNVPAVTGGKATVDGAEDFVVETFFLGSSIPAGTLTIVVNRTNNGTPMYATACTVTAGADTEVYEAGIVLTQNVSASVAEQSVDDGSPGTNSLRFAFHADGNNVVQSAGANSTRVLDIDIGGQTAEVAIETATGQGARLVGFTQAATSAHATVSLAVRQTGGGGGGGVLCCGGAFPRILLPGFYNDEN